MCFFPRNGVTLNDSLCHFVYQGISFPRGGKVSIDLCYFHTSTKWKLIQKETGYCGKRFSTKEETIVIFLCPQKNRKCYTSKFCFHKMERYLMIEWKILETET